MFMAIILLSNSFILQIWSQFSKCMHEIGSSLHFSCLTHAHKQHSAVCKPTTSFPNRGGIVEIINSVLICNCSLLFKPPKQRRMHYLCAKVFCFFFLKERKRTSKRVRRSEKELKKKRAIGVGFSTLGSM